MKIPRSAVLTLSTAATASAAWTTSRLSPNAFLGQRSVAAAAPRMISAGLTRRVGNNSPTTTRGMTMWLGNLFGGGGGAFEADKIIYDNLDHPGPELAQAAQEGKSLTTSTRDSNLAVATFAGGCFWGLELAYQRVPGVVYTAVGYTQGPEEAPTYNQVCSGATGHTEAVIVYYDPTECSYESLLDAFFERVNPTTVNGQGNDYGRQYRTGVYTHSQEQMELAKERFEQEQQNYKRPIATELKAATAFWPAEKYHQQYLEKGGRFGQPQDASKGATSEIRCYG